MDRHLKKVAASSLALALGCSVFSATSAYAVVAKPEYVVEVDQDITLSQLLLSGDKVGTKTWQGIPDGMGGVKNKDGSISVFVNHELSSGDAFVAKTEHSYGSFGSTISKVTVNGTATTVSKIEDAIKKVSYYNYEDAKFGDDPGAPEDASGTDSYGSPLHAAAINRLCSATMVTGDLATSVNEYVTRKKTVTVKVKGKNVKKTVTEYQKANGTWTTTKTTRPVTYGESNPIFITGEEGADESRIFALNTSTGELAQLPALGLGATENVSIADSATTKLKTVAIVGEDGEATDSQLFMFAGTKAKTGTWYQKAGLTGGKRYVANVLNSGSSVATDVAARTGLATKAISSAVRGTGNQATSTKLKIVDGVATITAANTFVAGETVSIAGLTDAQKTGVDVADVTIVSATATTYTFQTDGVDEAEADNVLVIATPSANRVVITTGAVHGLAEGDRVNIAGVTDLTGRYVVTSVPTTSKFTVETAAATNKTFSTGDSSLVNELLEVEFKSVATSIAGDSQQKIANLRGTEFARIEDGEFNPANPNEYFFITTQSDSDGTGVSGVKEAAAGSTPARDGGALWKLTFDNVGDPTGGATLELVLNGTEFPTYPTGVASIKLNKPDNLTFSADGTVAFIQEDPGGNDHVARLLALELSTKKLANVAEFDNNMFGYLGDSANNNQYVTNDEESSGIFDITSLLASTTTPTFMFNAQVHPVSSTGGTSYGTDLLKARATAILRPDLLDGWKTATAEFTGATVSTANKDMTMTLSGVTETTDADGLKDANGNVIAPNDIISISGITRAFNGTYAVKGYTAIDTDADEIKDQFKITVALDTTKSPWSTAGALADGAGSILLSDTDKDGELKDAIIEGGGLYTFKVTSLAKLFEDEIAE